MTEFTTISLIEQFTDAPGSRYKWQGDHSGEQFRDDFILPALSSSDKVSVDLNGALGLPSSFLDEAFGEIARSNPLLLKKLSISLDDNSVAKAYLNKILDGHVA